MLGRSGDADVDLEGKLKRERLEKDCGEMGVSAKLRKTTLCGDQENFDQREGRGSPKSKRGEQATVNPENHVPSQSSSYDKFVSVVRKEKITDRDAWRRWCDDHAIQRAKWGWPREGIKQHFEGFGFTTFRALAVCAKCDSGDETTRTGEILLCDG